MMFRLDSVSTLIESLNIDDDGSKHLGFSHLDDIELFTATTEELPVLTKTASNLVENSNKRAPFYTTTLYTTAKSFIGKLRHLFGDHRKDSVSECFDVLNTSKSHTRTKSIPRLPTF